METKDIAEHEHRALLRWQMLQADDERQRDRLPGLITRLGPGGVVRDTLETPVWNNSTLLTGDVPREVAKLKQDLAGEIVVYASRQLVHTLIEDDLADELRLTVYPVVLGSGKRLFDKTSDKKSLRLVNAQMVGDGLTHLTYEVVHPDKPVV